MKKIIVLTIAIVLFVSGKSNAELGISDYRDFRKGDRQIRVILQLVVEGIYNAIQDTMVTYEYKGHPFLFCVPKQKRFSIDEIYKIIDEEAEFAEKNKFLQKDTAISSIMISGFEKKYPCS